MRETGAPNWRAIPEDHSMASLTLELSQVHRLLLRKQHLSPPSARASVKDLAGEVGGLHATGAANTYLSLWSRRRGFTKDDLQTALYDDHSVAKVLCMRNTLFILPKELLPVAYQATKNRRDVLVDRYLRHYGVTRARYDECCDMVRRLLGNGAKTAAEIKRGLLDPETNLAVDLMPHDWRLVRGRPRGTWRSNLHEYSTFEVWYPDVDLGLLTPQEARAEVVEHYLARLGPATEHDIAWWSGLSRSEVRTALDSKVNELEEVEIKGLGSGYLLLSRDLDTLQSEPSQESYSFFLPSLDPYIMGYKDRTRFLDPSSSKKVFDRAGNALATVWQDGRVIGVWVEDSKRCAPQVLLFDEADSRLSMQLEEQAQRLSLFLEHDPPDIQMLRYPEDGYAQNPFRVARKS
jgi:hypothetical protein